MDIIRKQPLLLVSVFSILVLTVLMGMAVARLRSWEHVEAQEGAVAADGSFACEPLVFNLSPSASGSPIALASTSPTPAGSARPSTSPTATSTAKASGSASPTSSAIAQGGVSPTPTVRPSSTSAATATATAKPTSTAVASLPDAGFSTPTMIGLAAGFLLLLAAALLAL